MTSNCTHVDNLISDPKERCHDQSAALATRTLQKRRTHKSLPHKGEAVWPKFLEEVIFEALRIYRPIEKPGQRIAELQRFPKRNKCISEYIFRKTGKVRTAKQVGSRLQQIKETVDDPEVQRILTCKKFTNSPPPSRIAPPSVSATSSDSHPPPRLRSRVRKSPAVKYPSSPTEFPHFFYSSSTSPPSPPSVSPTTSPIMQSFPSDTPNTRRLRVQIDLGSDNLLPMSQLTQEAEKLVILDLDEHNFVGVDNESTLPQRRVSVPGTFCPQVGFNSMALNPDRAYRCVSAIFHDGQPVSDEMHEYDYLASSYELLPAGHWTTLFRTNLVPRFWPIISEDVNNAHRYTVIQTITESLDALSSPTFPLYPHGPIFSITYSFQYTPPWTHTGLPSAIQSYYMLSGTAPFPSSGAHTIDLGLENPSSFEDFASVQSSMSPSSPLSSDLNSGFLAYSFF